MEGVAHTSRLQRDPPIGPVFWGENHNDVHTVFVTFDVNFCESEREIRVEWLFDGKGTVRV